MNASTQETSASAGSRTASFEERIAQADRALQKERATLWLLRALPWLCATVLAVMAADVALHFSSGTRAALDAGAGLAVLAGALALAQIGYKRRNSVEHTARVLEARDVRLGSKLINLLQIRQQAAAPELSPLTRNMAAQAVDSYAQELDAWNLPALARTAEPREQGKRVLLYAAGLAALLAAAWDITRTEAPRFADPYGDHPPYSFTRIEISDPADDGARVVYGQNRFVGASTAGHRPGELFLSFHPPEHPEQRVTVPMFDKAERGFAQQIDGIKTDLVVVAHTRNWHSVSKQRKIGVVLTPKLEKAWVKITPPAYTGLAAEERPLQFKTLKALEGSAIQFRLESNRPLREGRIEVIRGPHETDAVAMTASGSHEVAGQVEARSPARLRFSLVDEDGHASDEIWEVTLNVTHDLPPDVQITNPSGDSFVAQDFKLEVIAEASDDYGLKSVRVHQARNNAWEEPHVTDFDKIVRNDRETLALDFKTLGAQPGDTFSFFVEAIDNAPEPHVARSRVVTVSVISTEEYNDFLREQIDIGDIQKKYSDLFNKLHDLVEEQQKLGQEIDALKQQAADAKDPSALAPKLDQLLAKQNEVNAKLNKLADTMDSFVRDKPLYDVESELQEALEDKASQIRKSTENNDADGKSIAQRSTTPDGRRQMNPQMATDLKQASDQQIQRLTGAEQQAQNQVEQPLEDMSLMHEILKDFNQLEALHNQQKTLEQQSQAYNRSGPLSRQDQLALKDLAAEQKEVGEALDELEQKLWEDGKAAQEKFPKAAQSAKDIAQKMGDLQFHKLASQATEALVNGRGDSGSQLASQLRGEMDKLYSECRSQGGQMSTELDQYLRLQRGMNPGNSFKQMMQCKKMGNGKTGMGMGQAGVGGRGGSAVVVGPNANVLGNETAVSNQSNTPSQKGLSQAKAEAASAGPALDKPDVVQNMNPVNRESGAVQGESPVEQYNDVVEKYFKAITK